MNTTNPNQLIIAVDFDGTIVEQCFPGIGIPKDWAFETLIMWKDFGHKLILWTCREDNQEGKHLTEAVEFCKEHGLVFDAVNKNVDGSPYAHLGAGRKVYADIYIDDKSMVPCWEYRTGGPLI